MHVDALCMLNLSTTHGLSAITDLATGMTCTGVLSCNDSVMKSREACTEAGETHNNDQAVSISWWQLELSVLDEQGTHLLRDALPVITSQP